MSATAPLDFDHVPVAVNAEPVLVDSSATSADLLPAVVASPPQVAEPRNRAAMSIMYLGLASFIAIAVIAAVLTFA